MEAKYQELKKRLGEISDLNSISSLMFWDQSTYMPPGGAEARGRHVAMLAQMAQEKQIAPEIGKLLDELQPWAEKQGKDSDELALIREARRNYDRATKVPPEFVGRVNEHASKSYQAWTKARPENDFKTMRPFLETTLELSREYANYFPGYDHIADPLIDLYDPGMKAATVRQIFAQLREKLVPLVQGATAQELTDDSLLRKHYPEEGQRAFGEMIIREYGYDFERGRQDKTHHPFMTKFSLGDVRITTRFDEKFLGDGLFSTLHEAGHAMYEQGIRREFEATPLGGGTSAGVHESQSRTWENVVGRSLPFWKHYFPKLQKAFPEQLGKAKLEDFYRAINKVEKSLIRVDADELTYNLHVMIRFDMEVDMLEGRLAVKDLPEAWHARYQADLGVRAPDDKDGALQDVHWYGGVIGGVFQGYTLGNIMSGLFYAQALKAHPEIPQEIEQGKFGTLHGWLQENIYQHGSKFTTGDLVKRVTGGELTIEPYISYLKNKYGELYKL